MKPTEKPPASSPPALQDEGFEFELTDLEEARRVLDSESMSQFDVASVASQEKWKRVRRDKRPTDRALSGVGIDWLMAMPVNVRPTHLASRFPRIVNALAEVWSDPAEQQATLDKLLGDGRKGRQGFPPEVHAELVALRQWAADLRGWEERF